MVEVHPFRLFPPATSNRFGISQLFAHGADLSLGRLFGLRHCARLYTTLERGLEAGSFAEKALQRLGVSCQVEAESAQRVPRQGAVVVVANHPFGGVEGLALIALLRQIRPDIKVLANPILARFPELSEVIIPLDPFGTRLSRRRNVPALRDAHRWLASGGLLVTFPAGEVSHFHLDCREVIDPAWQPGVARLVRRSGAAVVPIYFPGSNGLGFQAAGLLSNKLRTAMLARQLLNKRGMSLKMRIGEAIPARRLKPFATDRELVDYLRLRTYLLGQSSAGDGRKPAGKQAAVQQPLAPAVSSHSLAAEVAGLPADALVHAHGAFQVWCIQAVQSPLLLREIGRLRELTFRGHGEGTGGAIDLDSFDEYYLHLFIWSMERQEVVGAYRIGVCDEILKSRGIEGLYTNTLFRYRQELFEAIGPTLEMGRSFVRPEYQKSFAPLLLLWQGIGGFLVKNPRYRTLFGPVSISRDYSDLSRQFMASALSEHLLAKDLAQFVVPRLPVATGMPRIKGCPTNLTATFMNNIDTVDALVAGLEEKQKGLPVLLRQYLTLGGKILAFNLDPDFSEVIDGLILVDLDQTEPRMLERYLGKEGSVLFRAHAPRVRFAA